MAEKWTVKTAESEEPKSKQETEAAVLEQAVEAGEVPAELGVQNEDGVIKVNLDEPARVIKVNLDEPAQKQTEVEPESESAAPAQEQKEVPAEGEAQEPAIELITENEDTGEVKAATATPDQSQNALPQNQEPPRVLPEEVDKLLAFIDETGGTVEDYANLNRDITKLDDDAVIKEYYRQKHPHLSEERLERKMKKNFNYDEDLDEPDVILDKKDAFEDETVAARNFLEGRKEKYYSELKSQRQNELAPEVRQAVDYYSQQQEANEKNQKLVQTFNERTNQVFNEEFKGFDFKVGDAKYRYKVNDANQVKEQQSDLNNFIKKFIGEDGSIKDAAGYHKAIWAAENADQIAHHFYELGSANAIKEKTAQSKGINMNPRGQRSEDDVRKSGTQVKVVGGHDGKLRFKNYKNK